MKGHIKLNLSQRLIDFSPNPIPVKVKKIPVNRNAHFAKVKSSLNEALKKHDAMSIITDVFIGQENRPKKITLTFKENVEINERLAIKSLDSHGMTLLSVNKINDRIVANVSVPLDKLEKLDGLLNDYGSKDTIYKKPKNKDFIESISEIDYGDIRSLWFSSEPLTQDNNEILNVELWLDTSSLSSEDAINSLEHYARLFNFTVKFGHLKFKDRTIKIVCATLNQLSNLQLCFENIAEIRPANIVSGDFLELNSSDGFKWSSGLKFTKIPNLTPICILDTGINSKHPLLEPFVNDRCIITVEPEWTSEDRQGHGTGIAGLALYGDLKLAIQNDIIQISGIIESAKILPDVGINDPRLYGAITTDAVYNIEAINPSVRRIYTMAVTSQYSLRGIPSSWSSAVDILSSGTPDDSTKRLFIISAGNMDPSYLNDYPESNISSSIEDPANSYNALTVGYWASENNIITKGYRLLADITDLGPTSTTSSTWVDSAPFKPDVVFEGGNHGFDDSINFAADLEELSLMTTSNKFTSGEFFASFSETSAATAMAACFVSKVWGQYPDYWPETIRALVVHSATWPAKILERNLPIKNKQGVENLLRMSGYGYPNLSKAITSGDKSVNLIVEDQIQPYKIDGTLNKMVLYTLPWPSNELEKMNDEEVKLRVTLSYFIEPNPGQRGWSNKYKYTSHGLRFDFNSSGEESGEFVSRINKKFRDDNPDFDAGDSDSKKWLLGPTLRNRGSIHSDVWSGTAGELADKKYIAIFPVSGWWKELKRENRQASIARFSLIVSIETRENNIEIHNEISQLLKIETEVENVIKI